jgi:hypothetical protein
MQKITEADSGRGPVFGHGSANVHLPAGSVGYGEEGLRNRLRGLAREYDTLAADLKPQVLPERAFDIHGATVLSTVRTAFNMAQAEAREAARADAEFLTPVRPVEASFASWVWSTYRGMDATTKAVAVQADDLDTLTALVADGRNRGALTPAVLDVATTRYRELNTVERLGLQARFAAQPNINGRIHATGPDMEAAQAEARSLLVAHGERLAAVQANEKTARDLFAFLGAVFGKRPGEILDRVLGRPSA